MSIAHGPETVVLTPSKPTSLLAALLLHPGAVVSTGYLLRALWDEEPPATARAALQTCVLRLRRIFAKYGISATTIEAVPGGYRLHADADSLDLVAFRALAGRAPAATGPGEELYRLREALSLWHGQPLANVASRLLQRDAVPTLEQERLRVLERVCDLELAAGNCHQVLVDLYDIARRHPVRERFTEQLIEALYRTGRQAEALAEYRTVRDRLREELGIDPGPGLRRLELAILRAEELGGVRIPRQVLAQPVPARIPELPAARIASAAGGTSEDPALPAAPALPMDATATAAVATAAAVEAAPAPVRPALPGASAETVLPPPGFAGRAAGRAAMAAQLTAPDGPRLIVVSGAPGIGKSALALRCAYDAREAFPGGVFAVPLARPDGTPVTVEEARKLLPEPAGGRRLVLLDDAAGAGQVLPLLPAATAGNATVVVTSRRGLAAVVATHGGAVHRLDLLAPEEAYELLAGLVGADRIAAEAAAAGELAAVCGYLPLALRIAAGRLLTRPGLSVAHCADWLAEDPAGRLALAEDPRMSVPAVFGQAVDSLPPELREAFLRLGAHAAGTGLDPSDTEGVLEQLVEAGLLEDGPPGPYRMHPLLHLYARRRARPTRPTRQTTAPPAVTR
ncbi:AfsR family transcriptional regulator [Streptomyces venezuelae]|uniref:AfsR family transcriptional regulator n=1 Tax=Streptomyces venezuelae TaxID=54571 RepID=A0A5P2DD90_STRVZ|nr:AfsR family transcriptional regulator [Streptomyces venezuelae]